MKRDQEITLALRIRRSFFDSMLAAAVPSTWDRQRYSSRDDWSAEVQRSSVRLQWDPDHYPNGDQHERRAIQLGLRDDVLEQFGRRELLEVIDLSEFVAEQRRNLSSKSLPVLMTPQERVYRPQDEAVAAELRLADWM